MSSKLHVLIPDGCSTWALTVISCLSYNPHYRFYVLSNSKRTATKYSKFTSYYKYYERPSDEEWLQIMFNEIKENQISVIVPIAEREIGFCIRNRKELSELTHLIPLPEIHAFEIAVNKYSLSQYLSEKEIPGPKHGYFKNSNEALDTSFDFDFPILVKPLNEKGGDGIERFEDLESFKTLVSKYQKDTPIFLQEYVVGFDIDCSVICLNGEVLNHTIQKGTMQGDGPYAPQLGFDFLQEGKVLNTVKTLMQELNWSGVAHLDLRYDSNTHDFKIIEINARFWGSLDGSRVAGINFPDLAIQLATDGTIQKVEYKDMPYLRLKGVLKRLKRQPFLIFSIGFLKNNTELRSFFRDPWPTGFKFLEWLNRRI